MFQTVRHWWDEGRGKATARLFVFEFLVVMAGVLAAQGLQSWLAERNDNREGRALLAKAVAFVGNINRNVNYWRAHGQCLRNHVNDMGREAAAGHSLTAQQIGRPGLPSVDPLLFSEDQWDKISGVAPDAQVAALKNIPGNAETINRYTQDISDQWATLRLLDGDVGPASAEDRARVRLATAIIDNRIRWLMFNFSQFEKINEGSGWTLTSQRPESDRMVTDCGLLKDWQ